jgi:hypothetical protein
LCGEKFGKDFLAPCFDFIKTRSEQRCKHASLARTSGIIHKVFLNVRKSSELRAGKVDVWGLIGYPFTGWTVVGAREK